MSKKNDIRLLRIRYLRGPNLWTYRPVLETWLDLGELEDWPSNRLPGLNQRLTTWLPALIEHHCGVGERGGFLQRLEEGTWAGHILEHVVIELLNLAGMPTAFGQTRSTSRVGVYRMVFRARDEQVARSALAHGHKLLMAAINDEPFDVAAAVADITEQVDRSYLGPSTAAIVAAATDRRIPHIRLNDGNLVQLGHGARQRRIWTAETDRTSAIAQGIAGDKDLTKRLIAGCGVPVPEGQVVASPAEAWEAAQDIGLPVVVKPTDANHGRGVMLDLRTQAEVEAAFGIADREGSEVMVERYVPGDEHRLLVVGGRVVAAVRGESAWVTADGRSTVRQLVDAQLNSDPRRGEAEDYPLDKLVFEKNEVMVGELARQGLTPESVPEAGRKVVILRNGNLSIDCTDQVHPEVEHVATLAARIVGLDIAGIDLVAQDISRPLHAQGGAVVEVNAGPGLLMHLKPAVGQPRPVGRPIVEALFPEDARDPHPGRIPIVGIAGTRGTARIARLVAWLAQLRGLRVGLACAEGLYFDRRRLAAGDARPFDVAHRLLVNRNVQAAVFENDARCVLHDGLPYDRCTVGVVTDLDGAEALADFDVQTPEQVAKAVRTQVDVVLDDGVAVLNAADERIAAMADLCDGEVILYAVDPANPALQAHRARNGRVVFLQDGRPVLATGHAETRLASPSHVVRRGLDCVALLPVVATAWALDIPPDLIIAGIETFDAHNAAL